MTPVKRLLLSSEAKNFAKDNFALGVLSLLASIFNYLYYPLTGRYISSSQFAEVQVFALALLLLGTVLSVINILTVIYFSKTDEQTAQNLTTITQTILIRIFVSIGLLSIIFYPVIKDYLQINNLVLFIWFFVGLAINGVFVTGLSILQANKKFIDVGSASLIAAFAKLMLAFIIVKLGFGSSGVVAAISAGILLAIFFIALRSHIAKQVIKNLRHVFDFRQKVISAVSPYKNYVWGALIINLLLVGLFSVDSFIAKHSFNSEVAGEFAAVSTLSKVIIFVAMPITVTMLPSITKANKLEALHRYGLSVFAIVVLGLTQLLVLSIAGDLIIEYSFGSQYIAFTVLLPQLTIISLLGALAFISYNYMVVRSPKKSIVYGLLATAVMLAGSIMLGNPAVPADLTNYLLVLFGSVLAIGVIGVLSDYAKE